jgi:hypothetical protein
MRFDLLRYINPPIESSNNNQPITMCNGITNAGKQCTRKAEWCKTHLSQKPIEAAVVETPAPVVDEAVVDQKNDQPELIQVSEEIVHENIVPPMSPNTITPVSTQSDLPIVDEENFAPIQKIFNAHECFYAHRGSEYEYWVDKRAVGEAHITHTLNIQPDRYEHDINGCRVLRVLKYVGTHTTARYVWFYNPVDLYAFIAYFHGNEANPSDGSR